MSFIENTFPGYNDVNLHYMEKLVFDEELTPVLIVPALPESAIDYKDIIFLLTNRVITYTHRGREQSDAPKSGYSIKDHGEDIVCAIEHFNLEKVVIIAYSRGVPYFLQVLPKIKDKLKGVILIDYPAEYPAHPPTFSGKFIGQSWRSIPNKERFPNPFVLSKIQEESVETNLWDRVPLLSDVPIRLLVGSRSYTDPFLVATKVTETQLEKYKDLLPHIEVIEFEKSGHDLRLWEYDKFINTIRDFLKKIDPPKKIQEKNETEISQRSNMFSKLRNVFTKSPGIDKSKLIKINK